MYRNQECVYLFLLGSHLLATVIFLYGFFPMSSSSGRMADFNSMPDRLEVSQFPVESLYKRRIGRLVLMVIDALRYDFISEEHMPFTSKMISEGNAAFVKVRAHPPTVTLPRLKAMMTGTLPNYIDILMNFGSNTLALDSVVRQVTKKNMKVVFYGDDTWIKLFPTEFLRSEGTVSFFVNDFTEVDTNVTRNVRAELGRNDWDLMILHYLGLDHIGHLEGPSSTLVKPKLFEMDRVILDISEKLAEDDILIVCGDHGMKDSGGHGGTSLPELTVPLIIFNHFADCNDKFATINQIDIAPFISFLFGIPIPADNIGKLNYCLLKRYDCYSVLYALHYNAQQIGNLYFDHYKKDGFEHESFKHLLNGANLFDKWIQSGFTNQYNVSAQWYYLQSLEVMSRELMQVRAHFDLYAMIISVLIFLLIFTVTLLKDIYLILPKHSSIILGITVLLVCINYTICSVDSYDTSFCIHSLTHILLVVLTAFIIAVITNFVLYAPFKLKIPCSRNFVISFVIILQTVSLGSSSMVEEEHQVWYFLFVTLCLYFMYRSGSNKLFVALIMHRVLRKLNQTGDKWANLSDIGDWLNTTENKQLLSAVYFVTLVITGLIVIHISNRYLLKQNTFLKFLNRFLTIGLFLLIYCYRLAVGTLSFTVVEYPLSKGLVEIELFWIFFVALVIVQILGITYNLSNKNILNTQLYCLLFQIFCLIISLLCRPHNCILLPSLFLFCSLFSSFLKQDVELTTVIHYLLGKVFYFYQGNSNSLANIDVGVGYTGLNDYNPLKTGSFLVVHTFAAPLISYILFVYFLSTKNVFYKNRALVYKTILYIVVQEFLLYSIIVILQRHHLFVWSVFSPKLLYLSAYNGLYGILIICTEFIHTLINLFTAEKLKNMIYFNC